MRRIAFDITPLAPYRLDLTAWALKRREDNMWDRWDSDTGTYRRLIVHGGIPIDVSVSQTGPINSPLLRVTATVDSDSANITNGAIREEVEPILRLLLGTDVDLSRFHRMASIDATLSRLATTLTGLKPPRYSTLFEALTNAITCQQITLTAGLRILGRLAAVCGARMEDAVSFPLPGNVAQLSAQDLIDLGYSRQKARAMVELSALAVQGELEHSIINGLNDDEAVERLRQLYGVGRWSAEYALLRGDGRLSIFPGDDVGVRKHLEQWLKLDHRLNYDGVSHILETWQPFGGMIYLHLLTASLVDSGRVTGNEAIEAN
ncbi:MAG: DNA-3-methyladenine glycosylase 2 family protein [Dehalococcoidia bacterium]|nr:DNA-3-methyladenine glycosylase 2 family protein [Dehalococcoidia bacterium]